MKLDDEIKEKRPELSTCKGVIFQQDSARSYTSLVTRKKLLELGWEVMPDLPHSSDLAPFDYHSFRSLQNHSKEKTFDLNEAVKNELIQFLPLRTKLSTKAVQNSLDIKVDLYVNYVDFQDILNHPQV